MKYLSLALVLLFTLVLGACSTNAPGTVADRTTHVKPVSLSSAAARETVLLVSRIDGTVIKQTINFSADVCFKKSSDSATTCLTQGDPVIDPVTNTVIGFEMLEDHIDLVAKSD